MTITVSRAGRWKRRARYMTTGLGALALVAGALALPAGLDPVEPEFIDVETLEVGAGRTTIVCPGAPQLPSASTAAEVVYDLELDTGEETMDARTTLAAFGLPPEGVRTGEIGRDLKPAGAIIDAQPGPLSTVAQYPPTDGSAPSIAGATVAQAESGDLRGVAASPCLTPSSGAWLVGGNTEIGSSTQLVLANPGETAVRVRVTMWTEVGPGGEAVELIEPGTSTVLLTETVSRARRPAFHVAAEGGQIAAFLNTSSLEGIVPNGVSQVGPGAPPSVDTYVGPVHLEDFGAADWQTDMRILNPGTEPAEVSVLLLGPDGEEPLPGAQDLTVDPGVVSEIPVAASQAGEYTLHVTSTHPVVAASRTVAQGEEVEEVGGPPVDQSWLPSGQPTQEALAVTLPGSSTAMTNPGSEPVEVQMDYIDEGGQIHPGSIITLDGLATEIAQVPEEAVAVRVTGAPVLMSVQYQREADGALIDAVPATPGGTRGASIGVVVEN